jgi:signal transduction histidine kinase
VRRRLVLAIAGIAALAVGLFAVPLAVVIDRAHRDEALMRLQRDTVAATRSIDLAPASGDPLEIPPGAGPLAVYDRSGRRIGGSGGPAVADTVVRDALASGRPVARTGGGRLVVAVPLVAGERVAGAVRADRAAAAAAGGSWLTLALAAVAVIALAVLAAVLAARRLAAPLERLGAAARRLGDGDFSVRAPRSRIDEVDAVAAALDSAATRLGELVARERAFTADASHQLRTPLAALRIELEALELRDASGPELQAALAQVERLEQTIDTLLAVARDTPRQAAPTPLATMLDDAETRWRGPLARDGRPLRVRVDTGDDSVWMSATVLREIVDVLLDNACRHGRGVVMLRARDAGSALALDVSDEGAGLEGDPERAFTRRAGDGHGIGLALARSLAHAEGGRLIVTRAGPQPVFTLLVSRRPGVGAVDAPRAAMV